MEKTTKNSKKNFKIAESLREKFSKAIISTIYQLQPLYTVPKEIKSTHKLHSIGMAVEIEVKEVKAIDYDQTVYHVMRAFTELLTNQLIKIHQKHSEAQRAWGELLFMSLKHFHTEYEQPMIHTPREIQSVDHSPIKILLSNPEDPDSLSGTIILSPLVTTEKKQFRSSQSAIKFALFHLPQVEFKRNPENGNPIYQFTMRYLLFSTPPQ